MWLAHNKRTADRTVNPRNCHVAPTCIYAKTCNTIVNHENPYTTQNGRGGGTAFSDANRRIAALVSSSNAERTPGSSAPSGNSAN